MGITYIPFYPSDWLAGTRGLSDTETGVYITLVAMMYEQAGPIVRDDDRLWRLCGCRTKVAFLKSLNHLLNEGKFTAQGKHLSNERVQKVIEDVVKKSSKAKKAASARWDKNPNRNKDGQHAEASVEHMQEGMQSDMLERYHPKPKPNKDAAASASVSKSGVQMPSERDETQLAIVAFKAAAKQSGWSVPTKITAARRTKLRARLKDAGGLEGWYAALAKAQNSSYCCGDNARGWRLTFDFMLRDASFTKLMEGNYDNKVSTGGRYNGSTQTYSRRSSPFDRIKDANSDEGAQGQAEYSARTAIR